jgi:hypothetical protein
MGPYENAYTTTTGELHPQYAPILAREQQQPYVAVYAPAARDQYYVAPVAPSVPEVPLVPVPAPLPAPSARKRKGRSPMGHLPYPEDIARIKLRQSSVFSRLSSSPSSTPRPLSPVSQTLTSITYPDLELKGHSRGGDSECDGNGDDDDEGSPCRGRRGKKQVRKEQLACYFCRGRKIGCHTKNNSGEDMTCR